MTLSETQALVAETFRNLFAEESAVHSPPDPENHPAADLDFLDRLDNDALSAEERADFLRHIEQCPFCRHETASLIRSEILYAEPETEPVSGKRAAVKRKGFFRSISFTPSLLAAALLLLSIGAGLLFQTGTNRQSRLARRELSNLLTADDRACSNRISDYGYDLTGNAFLKGSAFLDPHAESVYAAYQKAVKAAPRDRNLRLDYARYQLRVLGLPADACDTLEKLLGEENAADRSQILMTYGIALFDIGDDAGAQKAFRQILELDRDSTDARLNLAVSLCRTGETDEALELFESVKDSPSVGEDLRRQIESTIDSLKE